VRSRPRTIRVAVVPHEDERLQPVERAAQEVLRVRLERREHPVLIFGGEAREPRREPDAERRQVLDERQRAQEIATHGGGDARDVAVDEPHDIGLVGRRDGRVGAVGRRDATGDVLDDDVLPGVQRLELREHRLGDDVPARPHERHRPRGRDERSHREREKPPA
jgi:hypothetical protein